MFLVKVTRKIELCCLVIVLETFEYARPRSEKEDAHPATTCPSSSGVSSMPPTSALHGNSITAGSNITVSFSLASSSYIFGSFTRAIRRDVPTHSLVLLSLPFRLSSLVRHEPAFKRLSSTFSSVNKIFHRKSSLCYNELKMVTCLGFGKIEQRITFFPRKRGRHFISPVFIERFLLLIFSSIVRSES